MNRYIILTVALNIGAISLQAQDWVKSFGHREGDAEVTGVVTDSENNILITGTFSSSELELSETKLLRSNGREDVFIIKYDPQGGIIWAQSLGGEKQEYAGDIDVDSKNNIYITGNFTSGQVQVGDTSIISAWPENVYVAKFDASGEFKWLSKSTKMTGWTKGAAVHCEGDQSVFITGYTRSKEMGFGEIDLSVNTNNNKGFYCKLDSKGDFTRAGLLGDTGDVRYMLADISADPPGNIYLAGQKTIHTKPDPVTYREYHDVMYFCKIDPEGEIIWTVEDTAFYLASNIIYHNDSLFVLGNREEYRMIFNGGTIDTTSSFFYGIFDTDSNKLMGRKETGALAYDLYADSERILVTGGLLLDHLELDGHWIHRNNDSSSISPIYRDIFFFETNLSGHINRIESISGSLEDIPTGIWLSNQGDLIYTGMFESAMLPVEGNNVINFSELSTFMHVSGTYYDRRIFSFLAFRSGFSVPVGDKSPEIDQLSIYPNPSTGIFHIHRKDSSGTALIRLHDLSGRLVYEQVIEGETITLNLSELENGLVIASFIEKKGVVIRPLLIQK